MSDNRSHSSRLARALPNCRPRRAERSAARRGAALFILLVFLGLAAIFITGWLTSAAAEHRLDRLAAYREQARWLAESAIGRASAQLARDTKYSGETWQVPSEHLGGNDAVVRIEIDREGAAADKSSIAAQVTVEVQLRDEDEKFATTRKQISIRRLKPEAT